MLPENKQKELAIALHKHFCYLNHTEQCAWYYEQSHNNIWACCAHKGWLEKAKYLITSTTYTSKKMLEALEIVNNLKISIIDRE